MLVNNLRHPEVFTTSNSPIKSKLRAILRHILLMGDVTNYPYIKIKKQGLKG